MNIIYIRSFPVVQGNGGGMASPIEQAQIRAEVESVLRDYGIVGKPDEANLSVSDIVRLREIALRVIHGDMDREELSIMTPEMTAELSAIVQHLIALRSSTPVRELEEINPYYSAFQPKVIWDRGKEVKGKK
jgi:hypothetical protein